MMFVIVKHMCFAYVLPYLLMMRCEKMQHIVMVYIKHIAVDQPYDTYNKENQHLSIDLV